MAIVHVAQVGTNSAHPVGGSSTATCTISTTPGAGHLLVVAYMAAQFAPISASDPKGNTWSVARTSANGSAAVLWTLQDVAHLVSGDVVTFTLAGNNFRYEIAIDEFSGVAASPVDATATTSFTSGTTRTFPAVTTTIANDLIYAMAGLTKGETSYTAGGSYTAWTYFTDATLSVEGQYLAVATVGSVTPTAATGGVTSTGSSITVAFKASTTVTTLTGIGIVSAEAFGTTRLKSPQYVSAAGAIPSKQAFGSGDSYGPAVYGQSVYGGGSAASLSTPSNTRQTVNGAGAIPAGAVGNPVLRIMGQLTTLRPTTITTTEAFGRPSLFAVDRTSSSYGGINLGDALIYAGATDSISPFAAGTDDALLCAGALADASLYQEQVSDVLIETGVLGDTPGH